LVIYNLLISFALIIGFYKYTKYFIFSYSGRVASFCELTRIYTYETAKGFVELPIVVFAHLIFCVMAIKTLGVHYDQLGLLKIPSFALCLEGMMLGIGVMGFSALIGRFYIEILRYFFVEKYPKDIKNWLAMARSGWIRHHFHTLEVLPIPLALSVTLGQVCAEEIMFRGVLINYFLPYGEATALIISTLLFMVMQVFHMPNRTCSVFPMIGALVMGGVGGYLYVKTHTLYPLIIAHITFFATAVL
jgi:membrane protease YdiL (CAAX protease family)